MNNDDDGTLYDEDAGLLARPYVASGGRTESSARLDLLALVCTTGQHEPRHVETDLAEVLLLCHQAISIAELSAQLHLPAQIIRVLVSDLIDIEAVQAHAPQPYDAAPDKELLEAVLAGLKRRL